MYLTSKNDYKTLELVLKSDAAKQHRANWKDNNEDGEEKNNPILVSVQQDYKKCTKLLYQHGFRIPQTLQDTGDTTFPGEDEEVRYERVTNPSSQKDQVQKLMVFKAYANPFYISLAFSEDTRLQPMDKMGAAEDLLEDDVIKDLQRLDPLRRTLSLAEKAESLSNNLDGMNELKYEYNEIKEELEAFGHQILTACSNMNETETVLEHNPYDNDDDEDDQETTNWQKALYEGRQRFVSHPLYQQNFSTNLYLDATLSPKKNSLGYSLWSRVKWNLKFVPYSLLISLFYPIFVVLDFVRDADLLFVSPAALKQRKRNQSQRRPGGEDLQGNDLKENRLFGFFRNAVHTPIFSMISNHTFQSTYLALLILMIWHRPTTNPDLERMYFSVRMAVTGFALMLLVDDFETLYRRRNQFFESFWNNYSILTNLMMVSGLLIQLGLDVIVEQPGDEDDRPKMSGNDPLSIAVTLYSIAVGLEVFKTLRYLLLFDYLGPVVICVTSVFKDVLLVLVVYAIIFGAHFVTLWTLFKPYDTHNAAAPESAPAQFELVEGDLSTRQKMLSSMFWRIIFADSPESANIKRVNATHDNFSMAFSHSMGMVIWGFYQIIMSILMLNILIAIMNTTYAKVWENVDQEWKSQRTYYQVKHT